MTDLKDKTQVIEKNKIFKTDFLLEDCTWSYRTASCLKNTGFRTISDVLAYGEINLLKIPNFGSRSLKEVKSVLEGNNLSFNQDYVWKTYTELLPLAETVTLHTDDLINAVRTHKINNFVTDCTEEFLDKFSSKDKGLLVMGVVMGQNNMLKFLKNVLYNGSIKNEGLIK